MLQKLYQKTLQANPNAPLMMVGMGEIGITEGKTNDARNRFETAISLTKKKDLTKRFLLWEEQMSMPNQAMQYMLLIN